MTVCAHVLGIHMLRHCSRVRPGLRGGFLALFGAKGVFLRVQARCRRQAVYVNRRSSIRILVVVVVDIEVVREIRGKVIASVGRPEVRAFP